jgi:hypothetical protein
MIRYGISHERLQIPAMSEDPSSLMAFIDSLQTKISEHFRTAERESIPLDALTGEKRHE